MTVRPTFYDVVVVADTPDLRKWGIAGKRGIVLGIAEPEEEGQETTYGVAIDGDVSYMVYEHEITLTGERVAPESIYDGSSVQVSVEGEILGVTLRPDPPSD